MPADSPSGFLLFEEERRRRRPSTDVCAAHFPCVWIVFPWAAAARGLVTSAIWVCLHRRHHHPCDYYHHQTPPTPLTPPAHHHHRLHAVQQPASFCFGRRCLMDAIVTRRGGCYQWYCLVVPISQFAAYLGSLIRVHYTHIKHSFMLYPELEKKS